MKPSIKKVLFAITKYDTPRKQKHEIDEFLQRLEVVTPSKHHQLASSTSPSTSFISMIKQEYSTLGLRAYGSSLLYLSL
jgi:hypothetical protein